MTFKQLRSRLADPIILGGLILLVLGEVQAQSDVLLSWLSPTAAGRVLSLIGILGVVVRWVQALPATPPEPDDNQQAGYVRPLMLALLLAVAVPATLMLHGCGTIGLAPASTFGERLAYGYSTQTAVLASTTAALNAGDIATDDAQRVLTVSDQAGQVLEARRKEGVSNGTVNRTLSLLRSVLRTAMNDWEWIERVPKVKLLHEAPGRVRFLTADEARRLIAELPQHMAAMVGFSMLTGLRQRNVRELRWSQVDLERRAVWIHPHEAKGRKGISVPLASEAARLLEMEKGKHEEFVFTYQGEPIRWVNNSAWRSALKRAGISGFRWHDLRHTWATWHAQTGTTPMHVLQELGGWASPVMVRRYAHLTTGHLAQHVDAFGDSVKLLPAADDTSATVAEGSRGQ